MSTILIPDSPGEAVASGEGTVLPPRRDAPPPVHERRSIGRMSREDMLALAGAALSAVCTTLLLFGRISSLSGKIGFVAVLFVVFLATYALLVSLTNDGPAVVDKVMASLLTAATFSGLVALASVVVFTLWKGRSALPKTNFYLDDMSTAGPLDPLSKGGISHAIVGTLIIIAIALLLTVPLGLACAVYLNEVGGRASSFVRTVVTAMTALPSIIAGLFIFATWVLILGFERSGLAAALAVSLMMLPIIIRSADVVLRLVPGSLREASAATGASHWRTVWHVVLPTARSGLVNSVLLGLARGLGETAPVLLTSGFTARMNTDPQHNAMMSMPLLVLDFVRSPQPVLRERGFAAASLLMVLVLVLFSVARILGGHAAGHLTARGAQRAASRSARDAQRFDARTRGEAA